MSVLSSSSFGSSLNSGANTLQLPAKERERSGLEEEEEDEDALDEQQTGIQLGVFGVIYTVSRERTVTWRFVVFKLFLDCWQLLMLIINPQYGWKIDGSQKWWKVLSIIQLTDFMMSRGLAFFLGCLYIFVCLLLGTVCICGWVAWSFKNKRFDHVWPITLLRWFGVIFFQCLDVASMSFFLITLDCQYFDVDPAVLGYNQEFPEKYCWQLPFLINVVVASLSLLAFVALSALFQMGEMELNMTTRNPLGMAHSKVEVQSFLIKFLMAAASTFLNNLKWLSTFYTVCGLMLVYVAVQWNPYYSSTMNYVRAAINGSVLYCAGMMMLLVYKPGVDDQDPSAVDAWQSKMTIVMLAGLVPAACVTALGSYLRIRYFLATVVGKFRNAAPNTKSHFIHEFTNPLEVEIASRCCRKWVDKDTLEDEAVTAAGTILKAGMQQLPGNAYMCILYSSYLIEVQGSYQSGLAQLKAARKADPSFLERFAIFSREQQHTQRASGARGKGAKGADLVSYVEQQRDYRLAIKVHKEALRVTGVFWRSLVHPVVKLEVLAQAVAEFDEACKQADRTYRSVILRNPENWKLIRMYSKFVEFIKNDPWTAAKWSAEADRLFQEEDDEKHNAVISDVTDGIIEEGQTTLAMKTAMDDGNRGVIIINAQGLMTAVNKTTCDVLGYAKKQLLGKNVSMLIPHPFSKPHDSYIANYVRTGTSVVLNQPAHVLALHQDRNCIPIGLVVTRISGAGMDTMFMGIFEHIPPPLNMACAWVMPTGAIMNVDPSFSDWFGYQNKDMPVGSNLTSLLVDPTTVSEAMKAVALKAKDKLADLPPDLALNALTTRLASETRDAGMLLSDVQIKHKYVGPINCSVSIMTQGIGLRHSFQINVRRPQQLQGMIVSDRRGKLCHVSSDVAKMLGYPVPVLLGEMAQNAWDILLPEPFCHLHRTYVTDLPASTPPFSCRSGLSMVLMTSSANGTEPQPFSMQIKPRKLESGDSCTIVSLTHTSMEQALDERRLALIVDENGIIVDVGNSSEKLFGYDPRRMLGMPISAFVDVFAHDDADGAAAGSHMQELLVELAIRSLSVPGSAFRVGVGAPVDMHVRQLTGLGRKSRRNSLLGDAIAAHILTQAQHPAVMQVKLHMGGEADGARSPIGNSVGGTTQPPSFSRSKSQQLVESIRSRSAAAAPALELHLEINEAPPVAAPESIIDSAQSIKLPAPPSVKRPPPTPPLVPASSAANPFAGSGSGLMLEVELWRADLMTGVLQLDSSGCVLATSDIPLFQPGLLLGVDSNALVGVHINDILTPMRHHGLDDLFLPELGAGTHGIHQAKKGGLKPQKKTNYDNDRKPGAVNIMSTVHLVDAFTLDLSVQAVPSTGPKKTTHVILRPHNPSTGMADFREWLKSHPQAGKEIPALEATLGGPPLWKLLPQHSIGGAGMPLVTAHLSAAQVHMLPHARSSASSMMAMAMTARPPLVSGSSKRRSTSVTILLPEQQAITPATLEGEGCMTQEPVAQYCKQGAAFGPGVHSTPGVKPPEAVEDPFYEQIDLALEELHTAASRPQSRRMKAGQMVEQSDPNGPNEISEVLHQNRTQEWVQGDGSVRSGSRGVPHFEVGDGMLPKSQTQLARRASLSGSDANSCEAGSGGSGGGGGDGDGGTKAAVLRADDVQEGPGDVDMLLTDAIGALGGHRSSPSDNGSGQDEPLADTKDKEAGGDYKRGQRFKRIARLLTGDAAKRDLRIFKLQAWGAASFVVMVTLACFTAMFMLLQKEQTGVLILNTIGLVGVEAGQVYNGMINCDILVGNQFVADLPGLQSTKDVQTECIDLTLDHAIKLQALLSTSFYSIMSLPDAHDLHAMWSTSYYNVTQYMDGVVPGDVMVSYQNMSLFDIGNQYAESALAMAQNIVKYNSTVPNWRVWSYPKFIHDASDPLFIGIAASMDGLIEVVIQGSENLNTVQYMLTAVEGCACSLAAMFFMFFLVTKVSIQRWNLYSVFMVVPMTLLRMLVRKTTMIDLWHNDGEVLQQEAATGQEADDSTAIKLNVGSAASLKNATIIGMIGAALSSLLFWRKRAAVSPVYTKRVLVRSHLTAVWLASPFLTWGIMMIAINMSGHAKLAQVSGPIAIFNLVNIVTMDLYRSGSLLKDMMQVGIAEDINTARTRFDTRYVMPDDYAAMLYGSVGVPTKSLPRYVLAPTGVAFSAHNGPETLFETHECLRVNQSTCLASNHTLYQVTHSGLDGMMRLYLRTVAAVRSMNNSDLIQYRQDLPQFATVWNIEPDIEGGLLMVNANFYQYVTSVYMDVLTIHIIGLVMTGLIIGVFLICMLRPFAHQLGNETKRIAELLSQLPCDVDVEGLIRRARISSKGADELPVHPGSGRDTGSGKDTLSGTGTDSFPPIMKGA